MNTVELTLDTLIYEQSPRLTIVYEKDDYSRGGLYFDNSSSDPMKWVFSWPDSLYERATAMSLSFPCDTAEYTVILRLPEAKEVPKANLFFFGRGNSKSKLKFIIKGTYPDLLTMTSDGAKLLTHYQTFYMVDTDDIELRASIEGAGLGLFGGGDYEKTLEQFAAWAAKYPDSRYLMARHQNTSVMYPSEADLRKVYDNFSEENKAGYWGAKIQRYLDEVYNSTRRFKNMEFPAWNTLEPEPIITDNSKHTLVIFSAAWCRPCHALIPTLKEIYRDVGDKVNLVYVSLEDEDRAEAWAKVMREYDIPWRSVMALGKYEYMQNEFMFRGIPAQYLVYPDGTMKEIDLNKPEDVEMCYNL